MGGMNRPMAPNAMSQMRSRPMPQKPPMQSLMPQQHQQVPPQGQNLAAVLANLNPEQQKNVLGERLYSYIVRNHPSVAAKITGMLLEMDNSEILNMLDSPAVLDSKIAEAQDVLNRHMSV
jgi:polyadenylate-binding protein